jgi:hypothetical protein
VLNFYHLVDIADPDEVSSSWLPLLCYMPMLHATKQMYHYHRFVVFTGTCLGTFLMLCKKVACCTRKEALLVLCCCAVLNIRVTACCTNVRSYIRLYCCCSRPKGCC